MLRDVTERMEGIEAGSALLVGTNRERIVATTKVLLYNEVQYNTMTRSRNPYGDGKSSIRIRDILKRLHGDMRL